MAEYSAAIARVHSLTLRPCSMIDIPRRLIYLLNLFLHARLVAICTAGRSVFGINDYASSVVKIFGRRPLFLRSIYGASF